MYNLGSLGSMTLEVVGTFQEVNKDDKVIDRPFKFKAKRMSTMDALEILRECPISMGLLSDEALMEFPVDELAAQRKREHDLMLERAKVCVPEEHHAMLSHIPYLNFLWLIDYLVRGDERAGGGKPVDKFIAALEKRHKEIRSDGSTVKKQGAKAAAAA